MIDHFGFVASIYDRIIGSPDTEHLASLLKLPTDGMILDAGGGTGRVSYRLRHLAGAIVVEDISHSMLKQARYKKNLLPVRSHAEILPFRDATFERILVVDSLHHFCDQEQALIDLLRVLKPGGRLVIEEPDIDRWVVRLAASMEKAAFMKSRFVRPVKIQDMIMSCGVPARIVSRDRFRAWIIADKEG